MRRLVLAILFAAACGDSHGAGTDGGSGGDGNPIGSDGAGGDGTLGTCDPNGPQCSNCIDDDGDGRIDGFDPECTGPNDNDESSFATGIPCDNIDPVEQDCFFDGNSGAGNDGCNVHVCCLLGAQTVEDCPIGANRYNPDDCPPPIGNNALTQQCIDTCGPLAPPGCDCFGCCMVCEPGSDQCYDIDINAADSPDCTEDTLSDPTKCLRCTPVLGCGNVTCGGDTCILCPGEDPNDLPDTCNGATCEPGQTACPDGNGCAADQYCANGCCIAVPG
ncbi:MAG TPA: hypothetical protein VGM88_32980 [Kofleriaceae bacterium]|jgi:hypothetical protein